MADPPDIADLVADRQVLRIWCNVCRHEAQADPVALALKLGEQTPVGRIAEHLKCTSCGASGKVKGQIFCMPSWADVPMGLAAR